MIFSRTPQSELISRHQPPELRSHPRLRFSKLFTGLLDTVFHKQLDPELQTLLAQQFQGEFVYKRTCPTCNTSTTSNQTFLELDVTLEASTSWTVDSV